MISHYTCLKVDFPHFDNHGILEAMTSHPPKHWTTLLVDLDDTLYPANSGVWDMISDRMEQYMRETLAIPAQDVHRIREELFQTYGTTLRGLQVTRHIDEIEFLRYVHDVPVDRLLAPHPILRQMFHAYPQRKAIFTNADRGHAQRVLKQMQLTDCFDTIIDILDITPFCKPMPQAFEIALRRLAVTNPSECIFIDDSLKNLAGARKMGIYTIRVGSDHPSPECDASIATLVDLPSILPTRPAHV